MPTGASAKCQAQRRRQGISFDSRTLVVANNYNDSISVIDTATRLFDTSDLRRSSGNEGTNSAAGGTFPFAVVVKAMGRPMCPTAP
jgi:hypothetical protein